MATEIFRGLLILGGCKNQRTKKFLGKLPKSTLTHLFLQLSGKNISKVIDVGTGATLIYPLLGVAVFGWNFIAIESDPSSFEYSSSLI